MRLGVRYSAWTFLGLAVALVSGRASADEDPDTAASFFSAGMAAYARHDNRAAAIAFEEAYRRAPRGGAAFNAARAWEAAGEPARAADDYAQALTRNDLGPDLAVRARDRVTQLEGSLARVDVTAPSAAVLALVHANVALPASVHVATGTHTLVVTFEDGRRVTRTVKLRAGEATPIDIQPPSEDAQPRAAPSTDAPAAPGRPLSAPSSIMPTIGWIALGAGAALGVGAVVLGVSAVSARDDWNASQLTDRGMHDRAVTFRTLTNIAWTGAAAFGVTGVVLLLASPSKASGGAFIGLGSAGWLQRF